MSVWFFIFVGTYLVHVGVSLIALWGEKSQVIPTLIWPLMDLLFLIAVLIYGDDDDDDEGDIICDNN